MIVSCLMKEENWGFANFLSGLDKKMEGISLRLSEEKTPVNLVSLGMVFPYEEQKPVMKGDIGDHYDVAGVPISIAMACYNHEQFVKDAIESVVYQTHPDWELIIIDDASTDESLEVIKDSIKEYGIKDRTVLIEHKENKGYGYSLGEAITKASNDLVVILDSDDVLYGDLVFQICIRTHLDNPEAALTYSNYYVCREALNIRGKLVSRQIRSDEVYFSPALEKDCESMRMTVKISHLKTIKKSLYELTEGIDPELRKTVDKDLVFKLEEVGGLVHIDKYLMLYRKHASSMATRYSKATKEEKGQIKKARKKMFRSAFKRRNLNSLELFIEGSKRDAVSRLFPYWEKNGVKLVGNPDWADVKMATARAKKSNVPTVLRLDGIYYDKETNNKERNRDINDSYVSAQAVIYQSQCSKRLCERHLAERTTEIFDVIHNGIDKEEWHHPIDHEGINIVSCSKWRRIKRLPEIIDIFTEFKGYYPKAKLHIIGPMSRGAKVIPCDGVIYYGPQPIKVVRDLIQKMDISIHFCKKDSCPSNVVESIGAGIPVVTTNLCGGAAEMCDLTEGCRVIYEGEQDFEEDYIYQEPYNQMTPDLKHSIVLAMCDLAEQKLRVELPEQLTIDFVAQKYLDLFRVLADDR